MSFIKSLLKALLFVNIFLAMLSCSKRAVSYTITDSLNTKDHNGELLNTTPVDKYGWLTVSGSSIKSTKTGKKIALRGASFGWHNWWPRFYNSGAVIELKNNFNVNVVRAAMGIDPKPDYTNRGYLNNPVVAKDYISKVVNAAIEQGIYVIIDWHCHDIITQTHGDITANAVEFFSEMAVKYKNTPNVIFEIFNEPRGGGATGDPDRVTWAQIKTYAQKVIQAIRDNGANNLILLGTPNWGSDITSVVQDPLQNVTNVAYTIHFYSNSGGSTPQSVSTYQLNYRKRVKAALDAGIPVFVSECAGMEASGDGKINYDTWYAWVEFMNNNYLSWVAWSVADKDETCSMLMKTATDSGPWPDEVIKDWGKLIKKYLKGDIISFNP